MILKEFQGKEGEQERDRLRVATPQQAQITGMAVRERNHLERHIYPGTNEGRENAISKIWVPVMVAVTGTLMSKNERSKNLMPIGVKTRMGTS